MLEHQHEHQRQYESIRLELEKFLTAHPEIIGDLRDKLSDVLAEKYFDTQQLKMDLIAAPSQEEWKMELLGIILSLESNESFVDAERKLKK